MPNTLPAPNPTAAEPAPLQARPYRERLLRVDDVCFITGLGRSTVYAKVKAGDFPGPVQLHGACVAWRETEVDAWIAARPAVPTLPAARAARPAGVAA
ncbi:AlpA family phage regulatory protein [Acidovorax sp. SUPP1855]|uniref:helix-turn-helix transcriptional regulator n=1 Tax=Acidovorax sp. SUPP1855 TaxID=431774 RepID=UPI0023DE5C95|nr:AlpA family transcriptional regulator [Acidovorax sp. SUPP1855]GKS83815.1 AlpA family phage regulatory protein [Acidovorax sp. SUPP1855]